jgi:hypothetical protein
MTNCSILIESHFKACSQKHSKVRLYCVCVCGSSSDSGLWWVVVAVVGMVVYSAHGAAGYEGFLLSHHAASGDESATLFRARIPALTNLGHQLHKVKHKEERNECK